MKWFYSGKIDYFSELVRTTWLNFHCLYLHIGVKTSISYRSGYFVASNCVEKNLIEDLFHYHHLRHSIRKYNEILISTQQRQKNLRKRSKATCYTHQRDITVFYCFLCWTIPTHHRHVKLLLLEPRLCLGCFLRRNLLNAYPCSCHKAVIIVVLS